MAFSALQALQAFGIGAQMQQQRRTLERQERELDRREQTRGAVSQAVGAGNYQGATQAALAGGEYDLAGTLNTLDENQRERAAQEAQVMGRAARRLRGLPADQRQSAYQQLAPLLQQSGMFSPEELASVDLSDGGLDGYIGAADAVMSVIQPRTGSTYRWRNNSGDLMEIGPDGTPRIVFDDPQQRIQWQRVEDPETGAIQLIPITPQGAPQQGSAELPPGFVLDDDEGGASPSDGSPTFP